MSNKEDKKMKDIISAILEDETVRSLSLEQVRLLPTMLKIEIENRIRDYNKVGTFELTRSLRIPENKDNFLCRCQRN